MELQQLWILYLFSCWHVLLPGHGKTLLITSCIYGGTRYQLLRIAAGYSLSHGIMMGLAAASGLLISDSLVALAGKHAMLIKNLYLPILFIVGTHLAIKAWKCKKAIPSEDKIENLSKSKFAIASKHPVITGISVGLIPCSDLLGLMAISPALVKTNENLLAAGITVWLGITTSVMGITAAILLLPINKITRKTPAWLAYGIAAIICFAVLIQRGWTIWHDYTLLY